MINGTGVKKRFISSSNCSNGIVQSGVISNCEQKENCTDQAKQVLLRGGEEVVEGVDKDDKLAKPVVNDEFLLDK
ncbi:tRNA N6-adenosine threonylcarbamoyltransferase [Trichinella spiralis]|uniref:tRNA N6-adenosine threonylcarbamoyltransferase n=1 Tax=Trichinella spiralis TaxID=6334 RepID=A0ABR3KSD1_TRISP